MDAMVRGNRDITAATTSDLTAGVVVCSETFPASSEQVTRARAFLNNNLKDHPARDTAVLLATEVATNAIRHSGTRFFGLTATRIADGGLRIVVIDEGRAGIPHLQNKSTDAESGRGMSIVDILARRWGVVRRPGVGVAVWFECTT
jgi:anti-sigma regulatory factor (Ser/Thr protein kinase)